MFICSNFTRKVKNIDLVKKIFESEELKDLKKIVIGKNSKDFFNESLKNLTIIDFINQEEIHKYLKKSKIVIIPSYIESYSITGIEAWENSCIPLTSINVGCNKFINKFYIIDSYEPLEWIEKIKIILKNYVYHQNTFYLNYKKGNTIDKLILNNKSNIKKNVLFITVDTPGIGGAATNTFNLIKNLENYFNIYSIFITDDDINLIENLDNYFIIKNNSDLIEELVKKYEYFNLNNIKFHTIFCKNYKVLISIKHIFKNINIIFSPSGLRYINDLVANNFKNNFINNLEIKPISDINYTNIHSITNFFTTNDICLDYLAMIYSDIVIANSILTNNLIKKLYKKFMINKLFKPVYTTNINYKNIDLENISLIKSYDILFCAYSWSRFCKNVNLVYDLINKLTNKKIIVIGKSFELELIKNKSNTIEYYENLSNNNMFEIYKKCKILVIPSFYDSNPNVLIEAISNNCGIITSNNIGNSENINKQNLVENPTDINEWIQKIENLLKKNNFIYNGPKSEEVKNKLINIINNIDYKKSIVSIYKIDPEWDSDDEKKNFVYFTYDIKTNEKFVKDIVNCDIYFDITYKLGIELGCNDINYIIVDTEIEINECYYVYKILPYFEGYVKIWKIKSKNELYYFSQANYYFIRGNYHNFYLNLIESSYSKVIFYPATSFKQSISKINYDITYTNNPYDVVLIHEDPKYKIFYKKNVCLEFNKFAPDSFIYLDLERTWDICFVATENQLTKNHHLFLNFLEYLDNNFYNFKIIYIGNITKISNDQNYCNKFKNIKLESKINVSKENLIKIYNQCRINMLFSGRDSFPRVIPESLACGCFNIALDTLKDGISIYNGFFGELVGDLSTDIINTNGSNSYIASKNLWEKIIKLIKKDYPHYKISCEFKKLYNINNFINELKNVI
jgi:hypothetical protein